MSQPSSDGAQSPLPTGERLQKVLARCEVGSRRVCEDLIADGRVSVNGVVAVLGRRVEVATDLIEVDGVPIGVAPGLVTYLLNKPAGTVSSVSDPQGRRCVVDLVPSSPAVVPVGRLDYDTEGLLLLTNDGPLVHLLTHPSRGVDKEYLAYLAAEPSPAALRALRRGIELDDGPTAPAKASMVGPRVLRLVIHEGRNRQVRRMCDAIGAPVERLVRTRVGPVRLVGLKPGEWRALSRGELRSLAEAAVPAAAGAAGGAAGSIRRR